MSRLASQHADLSRRTPAFASLFVVLAAMLLAAAALLVLNNFISIPFAFEENYNEGWNVFNIQRFFIDTVVYDDNLWRVNNYPPISFVVVGALDRLIDNPLFCGRIIAALSFVAVGMLAALATLRRGGDPVDALFAGGCALGFAYLAASAWVATDDPQTLAEAVMLGGLVVYLGGSPGRARLLAAAGLVMLAGFTKPNIVAIPIAITIDLALRGRRFLLFWLAVCAGLFTLLWAMTVLGARGSFLTHLLEPRAFAWWSVEFHLLRFVGIFAAPIVLTLLFSTRLFAGDRLVLGWYGAAALISGALFSGFEGASYNMLQDAAVFLAIAAGLLIHELRQREDVGAAARALLAILMSLPIIAGLPQVLASFAYQGNPLAAASQAQRSFLADAAYMADRHGTAICESLLLCSFAGQPFWLDPFNAREYILAGRLDQRPLIARIAAREFTVVELRAEICDAPASGNCRITHAPPKFQRFTDEILLAINANYRIDRRSALGVFYVPR